MKRPSARIKDIERKDVRGSLAAFMYASNAELGMSKGFMKIKHTCVRFLKYLGQGATSTVYRTHFDNKECVVKKPKKDIHFIEESKWLQKLQNKMGIPTILKFSSRGIIMEPKCEELTLHLFHSRGLNSYVTDLVNILKGVGIVNRDVRLPNIMANQDVHLSNIKDLRN